MKDISLLEIIVSRLLGNLSPSKTPVVEFIKLIKFIKFIKTGYFIFRFPLLRSAQ